MASVQILFIASIIFGLFLIILGFYNLRYAIKENRRPIRHRLIAIIFLTVGFSVHIFGASLNPGFSAYGSETGLILETIAHIILFVSFIIFFVSALNTLRSAREYWLK
jgi:hypothetical protein